jgi:hypothetical protein
MDDALKFQPEASDIVVTHRAWFHRVDATLARALIAVADIQSVFHPLDIEGWTGAVIDDTTLELIEGALMNLFEL